ncbi:hypothetical protein [Streptomyces canus]|uniref:hypothetical protein n=1 Tax=Streptomyces canus TaxID=58343 RepID=UPI00224CC7F5|nr:hypothetical protein [Streptomyces canus]MCX4852866.1 hypothetical protein [Streptomyces canus]
MPATAHPDTPDDLDAPTLLRRLAATDLRVIDLIDLTASLSPDSAHGYLVVRDGAAGLVSVLRSSDLPVFISRGQDPRAALPGVMIAPLGTTLADLLSAGTTSLFDLEPTMASILLVTSDGNPESVVPQELLVSA